MRDSIVISKKRFCDIDLNDPFFDSLKESYKDFHKWFHKKNCETAYVSYNDSGKLQGFLYLKLEDGPIDDVQPRINDEKALKIGTFKIDAHGTKLGERFVKLIVDELLFNNLSIAYITIFPQFKPLIAILERFGFIYYGIKTTLNGTEEVYIKKLSNAIDDPIKSYPLVNIRDKNIWLMGIKPQYHTKLFPDSILNTELSSELSDVPFSNSIFKVYVGGYHSFSQCKPGDCIAIYRTSDHKGPARYRSVVTSLCTLLEVKRANIFKNEHDFFNYCRKFSVFNRLELKNRYRANHYAVKLIYNYALPKRPTRGILIDNNLIPDKAYIGLYKLSHTAFNKLITLGDSNERYIIY